jgi:cytosine/adenosine deaminase-related metal-dependent hydrolase
VGIKERLEDSKIFLSRNTSIKTLGAYQPDRMRYLQGDIITSMGIRPAYLEIEDSHATLHDGTAPQSPPSQGYIVTGIINAHTHLGDAFIRHRGIALPHDVKKLVGPPNGLKHLLLRTAPPEEIIASMQRALRTMHDSGTIAFIDFREGGMPGLQQLHEAAHGSKVAPIIMSRPSTLTFKRREVSMLLKQSQGIGVSGIADWPKKDLDDLASYVKKKKMFFALHASEAVHEDMDRVLSLQPDFLIHCTRATPQDLKKVADANVPVVLCPRSYQFFNIPVDYKAFNDAGLTLMLGSDNAMLQSPNVLDDARALATAGIFPTDSLLEMVTTTPRKVLRIPDHIQGLNPMDYIVVLDKQTLNPLFQSSSQNPGV